MSVDPAEMRELAEELWPKVDELCEQLEMFYLPHIGCSAEEMAEVQDDDDLRVAEVLMHAMFARLLDAPAAVGELGSMWPEQFKEYGVDLPEYERIVLREQLHLFEACQHARGNPEMVDDLVARLQQSLVAAKAGGGSEG